MGRLGKVFGLAMAAGLAGSLAAGTPIGGGSTVRRAEPTACVTPAKRRAWHTLTTAEKKAYLDAELCVLTSPAKIPLPGAKTMYDELVANHQLHALLIHSTGTFLPYHRFFTHLHEMMLKECGFSGTTPYWDEIEDSKLKDLGQSAIFDPDTGFGGDGVSSRGGCIQTGPFVNVTVSIGPGNQHVPTCLARSISRRNNPLKLMNAAAQSTACFNYTTYAELWPCLYGQPHLLGHAAAGSLRPDTHTSPSDPTFFMHHSYLDKLWWDWQELDRDNRLWDIGGPNNQDPDIGFIEIPGNMEQEKKMFGDPSPEMQKWIPTGKEGDAGDQVTLNHVLTAFGHIPNATVGDIMDTRGDYLCFEYV